MNIYCSEFGLHLDLRIGGIILGGLVDRNKEYKAQQSTVNVGPFSIVFYSDWVSNWLFISTSCLKVFQKKTRGLVVDWHRQSNGITLRVGDFVVPGSNAGGSPCVAVPVELRPNNVNPVNHMNHTKFEHNMNIMKEAARQVGCGVTSKEPDLNQLKWLNLSEVLPQVLSGIRWTIKSESRSAALVALLAIGSFAGPALG